MTPDLERFLELATRPLEAIPPERDEAIGELMARAGHAGVPYDMLDLAAPLERLETAKPRNPWPRRIVLLASLLVMIGGVGTSVMVLSREVTVMSLASMMSMMMRFGASMGGSGNPLLLDHALQHAPELPLGLDLLGGGDLESGTAAWLARHPDDLAMLQEHLARKTREGGSGWTGLSPEEKSTIGRLDADNALWPLMQVAPYLNKATGVFSRYGVGHRTGGAIITEADFQSALRCFSDAAAKPAYHDRSLALKRRQIDAFPRARTLADNQIALSFAQFVTPVFDEYSGTLESLARFHCDRLVTAGDKEGLGKFSRDWQQLARKIAVSKDSFDTGTMVVISQLNAMGQSIVEALDKLGMAAERQEAADFQFRLHPLAAGVPMYSTPPEIKAAGGARLDGMDSVPRDLTVAELLPSRRTELAFLDRVIAALLAVLALIFTGLVGLEAYRRARRVRCMARGLMPLFRSVDHLWIGGLGLGLPWLWWWAITRVSPLGLRDLEFIPWHAMAWVLQPAAAFLFGLVLLLQTARWRWGIRGGFLGLAPSLGWLGWGIAAITGLAVPALGVFRYLKLNDDQSALFMTGVSGMAACGLLWLLWEGAMNLFTPRTSALRPNLAMRVLLPWTLAGVLTLLIAGSVSTAMERRWFAKDPLLPTGTSQTHLNALEERAAADLHESMRDL